MQSMSTLPRLYGHSLALLTDLYELTMAYGYWKQGLAERVSAFHLFFRREPFGGKYALACGLSYVVDFLQDLRFSRDDLSYLAELTGADGKPLFERAFLDYLGRMQFACGIDAVPEGTAVFAHEPLVRVRGPLLQAQIIETALLNFVNFQTLIATKAARVCRAAQQDPVIEFGLRRAQGIDGGISATRAAYIGGCAGTSNLLAGKLFEIPVRGTHAHSWIMAFDCELESFRAYAAALPNNCIFLVDTYDTLEGVRKAAIVGRELNAQGHAMLGVRLDSGDLGPLSIAAREILDEAGLRDAAIVASNDLDEYEIDRLKREGAKINMWGVGTHLATAYDQPALGGVYKLSALRNEPGAWDYKIKLSNEPIKVSNPGILQVRRFRSAGSFVADAIYDEAAGITAAARIVSLDDGRAISLPDGVENEDLLVPVFERGKLVYAVPSAAEARSRAREQLALLPDSVQVLKSAAAYPVGLEQGLDERKRRLMSLARGDAT
jgi:nicotinate phosphoribosyltransferase